MLKEQDFPDDLRYASDKRGVNRSVTIPAQHRRILWPYVYDGILV